MRKMKDNPYHPLYGLPHAMRLEAVKDTQTAPVAVVAEQHNVGTSTIYKWKKDLVGQHDRTGSTR